MQRRINFFDKVTQRIINRLMRQTRWNMTEAINRAIEVGGNIFDMANEHAPYDGLVVLDERFRQRYLDAVTLRDLLAFFSNWRHQVAYNTTSRTEEIIAAYKRAEELNSDTTIRQLVRTGANAIMAAGKARSFTLIVLLPNGNDHRETITMYF